MKRFALTLIVGMLFLLGGGSAAWADNGHGRGHGHGGGHGHGHSHHHHGHGGYGYGYGNVNPYRYGGFYRGPVWHDTTHYDYHAPSLPYHRGHYDYIPGHYHLHRGGHWDW